jgi:lambda repressor-like predicted transcriptional regulator
MKPTTELPNLSKHIAAVLKQRGTSMRILSKYLGYTPNYLTNALKGKNPRIEMLIALSNLMGMNLIDSYSYLLDPANRATAQERLLQQKIEQLTTELETVKAERDKYWEVVAKK